MIDTDKYEGHLMDKAIEDDSQVWCWSKWLLKNAENIEQMNATAELLKDAPLLLEEVKRLNRRLVEADCLIDTLQTIADNQAEEVKRLREVIEEMTRDITAEEAGEECKECGFPIDPINEVHPVGSECICDLKVKKNE